VNSEVLWQKDCFKLLMRGFLMNAVNRREWDVLRLTLVEFDWFFMRKNNDK
jgi:hypothetical protein